MIQSILSLSNAALSTRSLTASAAKGFTIAASMTVGDPRALKDKRRLTMLFAWTLDEAGAAAAAGIDIASLVPIAGAEFEAFVKGLTKAWPNSPSRHPESGGAMSNLSVVAGARRHRRAVPRSFA
jgi:hypothetical protein